MDKNLDNTDLFFWERMLFGNMLFEFKSLSKSGCMGTFIKCSETSCSGHSKDQDLELEIKA